MPTYEFLYRKCNKVFELVSSFAEHNRQEEKGIKCSKCGTSETEHRISTFKVKTSKKS